jgi:hypothetical protein
MWIEDPGFALARRRARGLLTHIQGPEPCDLEERRAAASARMRILASVLS